MQRFVVTTALLAVLVSTLAEAGTVTVTGKWINPTTGAAADGIRMERSTDGGATWTKACEVGPAGTECTDAPQPLGGTYHYRTTAFNAFGTKSSAAFLIATSAPSAPTGVTFIYSVQP